MKISPNTPCLCNSKKKYKHCCKIYHNGAKAKTAEILMRSRFAAFALNLTKYIIKTTHSLNKDYTSNISSWTEDIELFTLNTKFNKLKITEVINGEKESYVTFIAFLEQNDEDVSFCEKSKFIKENDEWLYFDGIFIEEGKQ
ncbi:MAG: hypothetical protein HRT40_05225 [Campylobacteraceae bacterium]|nr:hypothetical protein [Campylobacteraceae bacterium]